jgi:hypothetical protein
MANDLLDKIPDWLKSLSHMENALLAGWLYNRYVSSLDCLWKSASGK